MECGGHAVQLDDPDSLAYLPAGQSVHCAAAEVLEYLPGSQSEQFAAPAVSEKVPALQGWHPVTLSPKKPASHTQAALPPADVELAGHSCLSDVPPGQK